MDEIINEVKKSLTLILEGSKFDNLSDQDKSDFIERNSMLFEVEFTNHLLDSAPKEIANDKEKIIEYLQTVDLEKEVSIFLEKYKELIK